MGYYIETDVNKGKAEWLKRNAKAETYDKAWVSKDLIPVVVVDNGRFEAAAIAFNQREYTELTDPHDPRRIWKLLVPRDEVIRLCPPVADVLEW